MSVDKQTIEAVAEAIVEAGHVYHFEHDKLRFSCKPEHQALHLSKAAIQTLIDMGWRPAGENDENGLLCEKWLEYKQDMRPETRNNFLRACSSVFDTKHGTPEEKPNDR